jgi:hypothetical protein
MRQTGLIMLILSLCSLLTGLALAQTPDQRALIGRLQQGNAPCDPTSRDPAMMRVCSNRAVAREVGRQQGYCWSEPRTATSGSPVMRCDPNKRQP